jgi:hypothetical protein
MRLVQCAAFGCETLLDPERAKAQGGHCVQCWKTRQLPPELRVVTAERGAASSDALRSVHARS